MKKPFAAGTVTGSSPPSSASLRSCRSGTPERSSTLASTNAATGSSSAPTSIRVNAAPPCAKTNLPFSRRCGPRRHHGREKRAEGHGDPYDRVQVLGRARPAEVLGLLVEQGVPDVGGH